MIIASSYVPQELLLHICQFLDKEDVRSARLTCSALNIAASPFLIRAVWLSPRPDDWKVLKQIVKHPLFSKTTKAIWFDVTLCVLCGGECLDFDVFKKSLLKGIREEIKNVPPLALSWSSLRQCHEKYQQAYVSQESMQDYLDGGTGPPSQLFKCMHLALTLLPNAVSLALSEKRWHNLKGKLGKNECNASEPPNHTSCYRSDIVSNRMRLLTAGSANHPQRCTQWRLGFLAISVALGGCLNNIRSFEVHAIGRNGLSQDFFRMSPIEIEWACKAFQDIESLSLTLETYDPGSGEDWEQLLSSGTIGKVISAARQLTSLELSLAGSVGTVTTLPGLVGRDHWPKLRSISFSNMIIDTTELQAFLLSHKTTLNWLRLHDVALFGKSSEKSDHGPRDWNILLKSMLALD